MLISETVSYDTVSGCGIRSDPVDFKGQPHPRHPMTFHLQSPAGNVASFEQITDDLMSFVSGNDIVELPIADARKVWQALRLCQWQPLDRDALLRYVGVR